MSAPATSNQSANNDNSTMFSLSALVNGASVKPPPPSEPAPRTRETSGLIDLNAIARAAEERARAPKTEPPPAFARDAFPSEPPHGTMRGVRLLAVFAAIGALAVVGVAVGTMGGEEPKLKVAANAWEPRPELVVTAPPGQQTSSATAEFSKSSKDADSTTASHVKGAKPGARGRTFAGRGTPKLTKVASSGVEGAEAPKPKPPKPADPCGCHGDFKCTMACVAK
jgi:hypothetical protein